MNPEETDEPSDEEIALWLQTPEGIAAMREVMRKTVAGELGEVAPELLEMAQEGLKKHEAHDTASEVRVRLNALREKMAAPWEGSRWQHIHELNEEMKGLMDLMLELPEPHRTTLMKMAVPVQQDLEEMKKTY